MLGLSYAIRLSPRIEKRLATLFTPSPSRVGHPGDPYSRAPRRPRRTVRAAAPRGHPPPSRPPGCPHRPPTTPPLPPPPRASSSSRAARFAQPGCPRRPDHVVPAPAAARLVDVLARGLFRAARPPGCPCCLEVLPCASSSSPV